MAEEVIEETTKPVPSKEEVEQKYNACRLMDAENLENASLEDYEKMPDTLKDALRSHADYATAQADEPTKSTVQDATDETCKAIDGVSNAEEFFTKRPDTWRDFKDKQMERIHEAFEDLGALVGAEAKNAKENLTQHRDDIVDRTAKVVSTLKDASMFLKKRQELVEEETKAMRQSIEKSMMSMDELMELAKKEQNAEIMATLERSRQNIIEMSKTFAAMYEKSQKKHTMFIPAKIHQCLAAGNRTLKVTSAAIGAYAAVAKQAAKKKSTSLFLAVAKRIEKATHKAKTFMNTASDKLTQAVTKGADFIMDLPNYHLAIVHDAPKKAQIPSALAYVSEQMAAGKTDKEIREGMKKEYQTFSAGVDRELDRPYIKHALQNRETAVTH